MSEVDEKILVKAFLLFTGVSLMMMGIMALIVSQSAQASPESGGFVVIVGPFILAVGKSVPAYITVILVVLSLALILAFVYMMRRFLGVGEW